MPNLFDDPDAPPPATLVECPGCHATVPEDQLKLVGGRVLCRGCETAWFSDEDDEDRDE